MVCLVGLFIVAEAWGPFVLMIIYLIFALEPMRGALPKSLQVEEESLLALEDGHSTGLSKETKVTETSVANGTNGLGTTPHKKPNMLTQLVTQSWR